MEDIANKFDSFTKNPVSYLTVQSGIKDELKNFVKSVYDYTKSHEKHVKKGKKSALPELIVKDFDEEQIWQEIELQNGECWDQFVCEVSNCISNKNELVFPVEISKPRGNEARKNRKSNNNEFISEDFASEEEHSVSEAEFALQVSQDKEQAKSRKKQPYTSKSKMKSSIVDDKFFKLQEMENFLLHEEKKGDKAIDSDEESIDMFEDVDNDESGEEGEMMYNDFFTTQEDDQEDKQELVEEELSKPQNTQQKNDKKVTFADELESNSDDSDTTEQQINSKSSAKEIKENLEKTSDFELRQQRLRQRIEKLEEKTLREAPWQLKGEIDGLKRPQNSLLQEVLDFDLTTRPPPIITEQTTLTLEDIIRQRIKDKAWDDVVKKDKPVDDQLMFRKPEIIDQSKSKLSLAQVYEAEYLKQKQALSGDPEEEKEPESHTQIRDAISKLFSKLDALSHYHYTPKAPQAEVKIVTNTPAISMEEVAPVATSDATLLAPEEIKKKQRGDLMSKEERTKTDKNRERRKKKKLQKIKGKVAKITEHRNTSKGVESSDKSVKTSKAFFQQLNDNATSLIKRNVKNKRQ